MSLQNRKARPVPLEQYEDYGDIPPEGMDLEEVELIWWTVAPRLSKKELRKRLKGSLMAIAMPVASRTPQFQMLKAAVVTLGASSTFLSRC